MSTGSPDFPLDQETGRIFWDYLADRHLRFLLWVECRFKAKTHW